jgi:dUTP pyrophosphatase
MTQASLKIALLSATAKAPTRGSALAAGYDLYASEETVLRARGKGIVKTGVAMASPEGYYGRVAPRSGLAVKHGIDTGAGVIDADYRGEVGVALFNHSDVDYHGMCSSVVACIQTGS